MKLRVLSAATVALAIVAAASGRAAAPIQLHPENGHYFLFRGQPAVLITASEHYGAVLNLDFDYRTYLDELQRCGFNLTRSFSGGYREVPGSFGIKENTLAPAPQRFVCPWARSSVAEAIDGGNKFDLTQWDPEYFARLKEFLQQAGERGIVVEYVFFCTMYGEELWQASPMNARNNINGVGRVGRHEVYSAKEPELQTAQEALVRKVVTELNSFDNLYYEICNEPYERAGLTAEWNDRIAAVIVEAEANLPVKHLIAQGFSVQSPKITALNPRVSIFNFHAATPECASVNYHFNKVIADDETGGKGIADLPYRTEAWQFVLSGGAVFDHLDFSFTCARTDGTHQLTKEPGGGGPALRKQLQTLKAFIESFEFIKMKPQAILNLRARDGLTTHRPQAHALAEPGRAYAIYLRSDVACDFALELPSGNYRAEWVNPATGRTDKTESLRHSGGAVLLTPPEYLHDVALRITRTEAGETAPRR